MPRCIVYGLSDHQCTLTHVCNNAFADSSTSKIGPVHGGLSHLGKSAVKEMNRLGQTLLLCAVRKAPSFETDSGTGMIIDCSHVSPECAEQVLELTRAPVMFSHSNAQAVFDCPRNVPDAILDKVASNGGIVCVTFVPEHVATRRQDARMEMVGTKLWPNPHIMLSLTCFSGPPLLHRQPYRMVPRRSRFRLRWYSQRDPWP